MIMHQITFGLALCSALFDVGRSYEKVYDYVIVGGGTAGCVLASRLSEDPEVSVLLMEAGKDPQYDPFVPVPFAFYTLHTYPGNDWRFYTQPQKKSSTKKKLWLGQAKMLGGCGSLNGMEYIRGSPHDFDRWAEMGNKGWDYESVLPYFKKSEDMMIPRLREDSEFHGTGGPIQIRHPDKVPIIEEFKKAANQTGLGVTDDMNGAQFEGFADLQMNTDVRGHRLSTLEAFLRPVMGRRNLLVVTEVFVTKIGFDKSGKKPRATGVHFIKKGEDKFVQAGREVIVSAGTFNSPKLLMLSGIGPKKHLQKKGIEVVANLPVGKSLMDHLAVPLEVTVKETSPIPIKKVHTFENAFEYIFAGKGFYANFGYPANVFYKASTQPENDMFPYLEHIIGIQSLLLTGKYWELQESIRNGSGIIPELVKELQDTDRGYHKLDVPAIHLHLRTTGQVKLRSTNPHDTPIINMEYLKNDLDVKEVIEAIRMVQKLIQSSVLTDAQVNPISGPDPNCLTQEYDSDEYWDCFIRYNFKSFLHYTSTCKMAPDSTGVVDNKLRVKLVDGLLVVDTSVMPMIPSTHTQAPVIMIAEKAADLIKAARKGK